MDDCVSTRSCMTRDQVTNFRLKEFMNRRYEFRWNTVLEEFFYRWFLSMTAHWPNIDRQHGNNTSPLPVGAQYYRKSTFCHILLPPELCFGYTDNIDFKSKQDAERSLGRFS